MTKFAEGALNLTRFHALFEAAIEGMVVIGPDGIVSDINPAMEALFGYSSEEITGKNVSVLMPEPDHSNHDEYIRRYRKESTPRIIGLGREVVGRHKQGKLFPVYLSVGEFKTSTMEGYVGILRDLTETNATADELLRTRAELESTLQYAPVAIFTLDSEGLVKKSNEAARSVLGLPQVESDCVLNIIELTAENDRQEQSEALHRLWSGHVDSIKKSLHYVTSTGDVLSCRGHYALVRSPQGEPAFIILELTDLTPLVNAEQDAALHREQLALAGRVEALGEMTASIAHELNQPLAAITLYAKTAERILANNPTEDGIVESILEKISAQALRAGQVIKQVRSLVEKSAHEAETHDLREIVQEALLLGAVDARASGIQLIVEMGDKPLWVNADPIQIQQVLLNLMRNALDALVSCQPPTPCIEVFVSAEYDKASVEVRDNGPGVDIDILANLFRPFITNKEHGMGIGLSLSHSIVKRHQGSLEHVAAYSGGTCFKMSLPLIQFASDSKVT